MKINSAQLDNWLQKLSALRLVLVYGPEEGQIRLVTQKLYKHFLSDSDPDFNLVTFNYKQIKDDLSTLRDEMASVSLLGGNKVIVIEDCAATIAKELQELLKKPIGKAKVILVSDDLKPTSNLRKLFEGEEHCAAIACYKDDVRQMQKFISEYMTSNSMQYEVSVPQALANILPANRLLVTSELEKLNTYCNREKIKLEDVAASVADCKELLLDELCFAFLRPEGKAIPKLITTMIAEDTNFVLIIRVLLRYTLRMLEVKNAMRLGKNAETAVAALKPPVFFKQRDNLTQLARVVALEKLSLLLKKLLQLEMDCKSGKLDPQLLTFNFLVQEVTG